MAKIDDLTQQVSDPRLRRELEAAVAELKKRTRFGLVYESHLPEMTALPACRSPWVPLSCAGKNCLRVMLLRCVPSRVAWRPWNPSRAGRNSARRWRN